NLHFLVHSLPLLLESHLLSLVLVVKSLFFCCCSDVPIAQFITHLDRAGPKILEKFITEILKLDTSCMFVKPQSEEMIRCEIFKFRNQISFAKPTSSPFLACLLDVYIVRLK
ncbi:hypothetical protein DY000_02015309, partial [Brassica cretica]